ncbi:MAG: cytoplasmic protein [Thermodesulfobacteriota bacterium]
MNATGQKQDINFTVDRNNLYREESVTDLKVATIRQLIPIKADGSPDPGRTTIFVGHTQLMSPEGPLPIQAKLEANNFTEAMDVFPRAMQQALADMIESLREMQREREAQQRNDSRIIVPGR